METRNIFVNPAWRVFPQAKMFCANSCCETEKALPRNSFCSIFKISLEAFLERPIELIITVVLANNSLSRLGIFVGTKDKWYYVKRHLVKWDSDLDSCT